MIVMNEDEEFSMRVDSNTDIKSEGLTDYLQAI